MKGLSLDFLMLLIGNIFLYQIFFWLIDIPGTKKLLGLQTDSLWLYTAYFSFISMFVAYPAVYFIPASRNRIFAHGRGASCDALEMKILTSRSKRAAFLLYFFYV